MRTRKLHQNFITPRRSRLATEYQQRGSPLVRQQSSFSCARFPSDGVGCSLTAWLCFDGAFFFAGMAGGDGRPHEEREVASGGEKKQTFRDAHAGQGRLYRGGEF